MLAAMEPPAMPMALGVLYCNPGFPLDASPRTTETRKSDLPSGADLDALLRRGDTWTVTG
jgi:hypothetical protein